MNIENHKWIFAKKFEKVSPHEYIIRNKDTEDVFVFFEENITKEWHDVLFFNRTYKLFDYLWYSYWIMNGYNWEKNFILNRKKICEQK